MNSRIFANILNGFLEKLQRQDLVVVTKDMMSFLNFLVSFRDPTRDGWIKEFIKRK
jgi:hypothetical protein